MDLDKMMKVLEVAMDEMSSTIPLVHMALRQAIKEKDYEMIEVLTPLVMMNIEKSA